MTMFVVQARGTDDAALVRARFLAEGFSWGAFILAELWLLYHRLWFAFLLWVLAELAFFFFVVPHVSGWIVAAVNILARIFVGLEGNRMRQGKGARRASLVDLVEARDRDEAEAIFYRRHRLRTAIATREARDMGERQSDGQMSGMGETSP